MRRALILTTTLMALFLWFQSGVNAQEKSVIRQHYVKPGDTWLALSMRYEIPLEKLQANYGHINQQMQPPIGAIITLPDDPVKKNRGQLVRPFAGGLLSTSAIHNLSPWQLALSQKLDHPYRPLLYDPLWLPGRSELLSEFPIEVAWLEVSAVPARPGETLAVRGASTAGNEIQIQLNQLDWFAAVQQNRFAALGGTGAFFDDSLAELLIQPAGAPAWSQPWLFVPGEWTYEQFTYSGAAASITNEDILAERARLKEVWTHSAPQPLWETPFQLPIDNFVEITSLYGARRSVDDGPYDRYHEGVDFSAFGGTPVFAPASGQVALAENLAVRGGAVIIDHGLGIHTGFYHLSKILVEPGQMVLAGEQVGAVGTTGLSTGNHLHWDFLAGATWVNGRAWLDANLACWLLKGLGQTCSTPERPNILS